MADNQANSGSADRVRINLNQRYELAYWKKTLDVSEEQLREAIKAVGVMASDVRRFLKK